MPVSKRKAFTEEVNYMHVVKIPIFIVNDDFFADTFLHISFTIDKSDKSAQIIDFSYPIQSLYDSNPDIDKHIRNAVERYLQEYFDV